MAYSARWVAEGLYIIGDREYGHDLGSFHLYSDVAAILPEKVKEKLAQDVALLMVKAYDNAEVMEDAG